VHQPCARSREDWHPATLTRELKRTTHPDYRLYKPWLHGIAAQHSSNLPDGRPDPVFGVDKNVFAPESLDNLLPSHNLSFVLNQQVPCAVDENQRRHGKRV
jgi:hypothetical protein